MNSQLRDAKKIIRPGLRAYSDEAVCRALAFAQDGEMPYAPCGECLLGRLTGSKEWAAPVHTENSDWRMSRAYNHLDPRDIHDDTLRYKRIIPILKAELRRRDRERKDPEVLLAQEVAQAEDAYDVDAALTSWLMRMALKGGK